MTNFCRDYAGTLPFTLSLTQIQDTVRGIFALGQIQFGQTTAIVSLSGDLALESTNASGSDPSVSGQWTLNSEFPQQLTGTIRHTWLANDNGGAATVTGEIRSSSRSGLPGLPAAR